MKRKPASAFLSLSPSDIVDAYHRHYSKLPENAANPRFFEKLGKIRKRLFLAHERLKSWERVAEQPEYFPVPGGTLSTIVKHGYIPVKWFEHFKLPTFAPAPVCARCGKVHVTKRCTTRKRKYKDLFSVPPKTLLFMLENREEIK